MTEESNSFRGALWNFTAAAHLEVSALFSFLSPPIADTVMKMMNMLPFLGIAISRLTVIV